MPAFMNVHVLCRTGNLSSCHMVTFVTAAIVCLLTILPGSLCHLFSHMSYSRQDCTAVCHGCSASQKSPQRVFSTVYCPNTNLISSAINICCIARNPGGRHGVLMCTTFLQVLDILADLVSDQHGVERAVQGLLSSGAGSHHLLHCWSAVHLCACFLWWHHAG